MYRVRFLTTEIAKLELDQLGYPDPKPYAIVTGGMLGDADVSELIAAGGMIYEFEYRGGKVRAYIHRPQDLEEYENYNGK